MKFTIFFYIFQATAFISFFVSFLAWRRKEVLGAIELSRLMLFTGIYAFFIAFEATSLNISDKILWTKIAYVGAVAVPVLYFIFIMRYTGHKKVSSLRNTLLLFTLPAITLILAITNEKHHLIWTGFSPISPQNNIMEYYHGVWFWIFYMVFDYILLFFATISLFDFIFRHKKVFRVQGWAIFIAGILPWVGGVVYLTNLNPIPGFDIAPASTMLSGILLIFAILRVGFLDLVPIARETLVETLEDGIIALDAKNRVQDINGAACSYLGLTDKSVLGLPVDSFCTSFKPFINALLSVDSFDQFEFEDKQETKTLKIIKQNIIGEPGSRLIVIRDITDQVAKQMEIKTRDNLLSAITKAATLLIQGENLEESLYGSMEIIGKATGINRVCIFRSDFNASDNRTFLSFIYEWTDGSPESQRDKRDNSYLSKEIKLMNWHDRLSHGKVCLGKVADFNQPEKSVFEAQNIKSILVVPVFIDKRYWGFIGFDDCLYNREWTSTEENILTTAAGTIGSVYVRKKNQEELIVAKEKAEESDRLKTAFLTNMSHEIRTPMNSILGFVSLLQEPNLTGDEKNEYFSIIKKSGERLLNTIQDIMDSARIESGQMMVKKTDVDINEMDLTLYALFKTEAEAKGLAFSQPAILPDVMALIKTDKYKVYSVRTNLIKNALKYTKEGSIEIGCIREPDNVLFYVKDTGIGISKDKREAIFNRFVQADGSSTRSYEGSGLGLSISKAYVEMLGGKIWVDSEVNKGSTFYFQIPVQKL